MVRTSPEYPGLDDSNAMNVDKEEKNSNNDGGSDDGEEGGGSEYEIEEILDAKRGAFPNGRMGYFVKWKGYGPEENSWVDEEDTENAKELVEEFWKKNPKRKQPRKSVDTKASKRARPSVADDDESDTNSVAKKRGRKSIAKVSESDDEEVSAARTKRNKRTEKQPTKGKPQELQRHTTMAKYMEKEIWEDLVSTVDTVERTDEGLVIYFTLTNGESIRERASLCRMRFPQKLLAFYESNLKWRMAEADDD